MRVRARPLARFLRGRSPVRTTLEGKKFILLTILIAVASFNTGNNLITLIFSMLLAILVVSIAALWLNLRSLTLDVTSALPVHAGESAALELELRCAKSRMGAYSIRIVLPPGAEGDALVPYVRAGGRAAVRGHVTFARRGVYRLRDFRLSSGFPFIFFTGTVRASAGGAEVVVYPALRDVSRLIPAIEGSGEGRPTIRRGVGDDILGLREIRAGEDMKYVSWRASAKARKLLVREFAEEEPRTVTIMLDDGGPRDEAAFESAVSIAASLAHELIVKGHAVKLVSREGVIPAGVGLDHLARIMYQLAIAGPGDETGVPLEAATGVPVFVLSSSRLPPGAALPPEALVVHAENL